MARYIDAEKQNCLRGEQRELGIGGQTNDR